MEKKICHGCLQYRDIQDFFKGEKHLPKCRYCMEEYRQKRRKNMNRSQEAPHGKAWCSGCQMYHHIRMFSKSKSSPSGVGSYCKKYAKKYHSKWFQEVGKYQRKQQMEKREHTWEIKEAEQDQVQGKEALISSAVADKHAGQS